jgi:dethiobiotin synthetase
LKRTIFITGTDTGAGKTVLTALLAAFFRSQKIRVAAFKPVCSGGRADAEKIRAALGGVLTLDEINPWHFRAAIAPVLAARRENKFVTLAQVLAHLHATRKNFAVTLVEGAGGLLSPLGDCSGGLRPSPQASALTERRYKKSFDSRDLILALRAAPVIVAQNKLGVVNHLLLTLEALPKNSRASAKIVLMSPAKPDSATKTNAKLLGEFFPPEKIFTLPWLGNRFPPAAVLKNLAVRRVLQKLAL